MNRAGRWLTVAGIWLATAVANAQPAVSLGGHFSLEDLNGHPVTEKSFQGKWQLIYFGFTSCPETCPTALHQVHTALDALGPDALSVQPLFVTLDPERDTPERLGAYLRHFDPRIVGLRGGREQTDAAAAAFRVYFQIKKTTTQSAAYTIDHSSFLFLMKPDGGFARLLQADGSGHVLADALRNQLRQ